MESLIDEISPRNHGIKKSFFSIINFTTGTSKGVSSQGVLSAGIKLFTHKHMVLVSKESKCIFSESEKFQRGEFKFTNF